MAYTLAKREAANPDLVYVEIRRRPTTRWSCTEQKETIADDSWRRYARLVCSATQKMTFPLAIFGKSAFEQANL
jgi:hypothetical protein